MLQGVSTLVSNYGFPTGLIVDRCSSLFNENEDVPSMPRVTVYSHVA
jgi:hypothetical protein